MTDELKLPQVGELKLPQWQEWLVRYLVRYNAILTEKERRIEQLEAALRPFAEIADVYEPDDGDNNDLAWYCQKGIPTIGMLRNARAALAGEKKDG